PKEAALTSCSNKVIEVLETNSIDSEWKTLVNELVHWILTKKQTSLERREVQCVGETLFRQYPSIGKPGYRLWSCLCRSMTMKLRRERDRRGLPN
ncbi:unnamed protein product, partial [Rotaria magnacalcarata]